VTQCRKSTLLNRLIAERMTGPDRHHPRCDRGGWAGAVADPLFDTAGMRPGRASTRLDNVGCRYLRAIRFAETWSSSSDALQPLERQDLTIADLVAEEAGRLYLRQHGMRLRS